MIDLPTVWFVVIAFLWVGYFVLEGFDFGVGMLSLPLGRDDRERRVVINTIGPHFDANEVWLITAAGATFAAFPDWYATLFSGFYLPLLVILVALIVRLVGIDYRSKRRELSWRRRWDALIGASSLVATLLWGIVLGNFVTGVPLDSTGEFVGSLADVLRPVPLLTGGLMLVLFLLHGATFVTLKADGEIRTRAATFARRAGTAAVPLLGLWLSWLVTQSSSVATGALAGAALAALVGSLLATHRRREGWAFASTAATIGLVVAAIFTDLFPAVLRSSRNPAWDLTVANASSSPYTLTIMTWASAAVLPFVLAYQAWSYWVFRRRLRTDLINDDSIDDRGTDRVDGPPDNASSPRPDEEATRPNPGLPRAADPSHRLNERRGR